MILYMFQGHSPKSSHHLPLPESKRLCHTSVSLLLSHIQGYCYHLSKLHIYALDCVGHNKLWKILKEMGIPDRLTCLLRNLYAGQEATVRTGHGTADWFQIGKRVRQSCILSPCLFNLYAKYIMRNVGWRKHKLKSRLLGEISITSNMQMTPALWQKVKRN